MSKCMITIAVLLVAATRVDVTGMVNADNDDWVIWVKNADGVQKL